MIPIRTILLSTLLLFTISTAHAGQHPNHKGEEAVSKVDIQLAKIQPEQRPQHFLLFLGATSILLLGAGILTMNQKDPAISSTSLSKLYLSRKDDLWRS